MTVKLKATRRDLQAIREDIYENAAFNANLEKIITNTIEIAQPAQPERR